MIRFASSFVLLFASLAAAAQPMEVAAEYRVTNSGITIGSIRESFVRKDDRYSIQSVTRSEGMLKALLDDQITVESTGRVDANGLQPLEYSERRLKDPKRDLKSTFDRDKGVMRTVLHGEVTETALPAGTQDRISVMYQFMHMRAFPETLVLPIAERRKIEVHVYRFVGDERIETPLGAFETRHYQRVVGNAADTRADVWLAKERSNFPVRAIFDDPKGFRLEQGIVSLTTR
ncbi:MAG: DUF3108 domain-containing protein [Usitatibacter sp.]